MAFPGGVLDRVRGCEPLSRRARCNNGVLPLLCGNLGRKYMRLGVCLGLALGVVVGSSAAAQAEDAIKIGFPMPLSGPAAVYGVPVTKGAQMAVEEINAKGGVLGRKLELLSRDSKANADEAVRLARELIIKDNADFLSGTLTSAEAPAVST